MGEGRTKKNRGKIRYKNAVKKNTYIRVYFMHIVVFIYSRAAVVVIRNVDIRYPKKKT